jgi:hypothetical protein
MDPNHSHNFSGHPHHDAFANAWNIPVIRGPFQSQQGPSRSLDYSMDYSQSRQLGFPLDVSLSPQAPSDRVPNQFPSMTRFLTFTAIKSRFRHLSAAPTCDIWATILGFPHGRQSTCRSTSSISPRNVHRSIRQGRSEEDRQL